MSSTGAGSSKVAIRNVKSAVLPRNRSRAKGNANSEKVRTGAVAGLSAAVSIQPTGSRMNRLARMSTADTNTACSIRGRRGKRGDGGPTPGLSSVRCTAVRCATRAIVLLLRLVEDEAPLELHHYNDHEHAEDSEDPS